MKSGAVRVCPEGARGCVDVRLRCGYVHVRLRRVGPATTQPRMNDRTSPHFPRSAQYTSAWTPSGMISLTKT
ncbi:hypothetical protein GCM10009680_79570 [Streptomyces yatensis]|uniref:Uncharacterized protein n=1 Tax=Streptomyces yatensis TaxID=155177 RepID=A0ABN2JH69_9ACTN